MRILVGSLCVLVVATAASRRSASPMPHAAPPRQSADTVARVSLEHLSWSGKPGGVQIANIEGDPMVPDRPYTVALRIGSGVWIQPHWHPKLQHVVVLDGTLLLGRGDDLDSLSALVMKVGDVAVIPSEARHYEGGRSSTTILIYGVGPMTTTFVRPPRRTPQTTMRRN